MLSFVLLLVVIFVACLGITYSALTSSKTAIGMITIDVPQPVTISFTGDTYGLNGDKFTPSVVEAMQGDILSIMSPESVRIFLEFYLNDVLVYRPYKSFQNGNYYAVKKCYVNGTEYVYDFSNIINIEITTDIVIECVWEFNSRV